MSWTLFFFRRVGQPELAIEEVDPLFARLPRFTRHPPREQDRLAEREVRFRYTNPVTGVSFDFTFQTPEEAPRGEEGGRVDFPYEETPLRLRLESLHSPESAQEAMPVAAEVCQCLDLLVLDPQEDQELPGPPDVDALIRSYLRLSRAVDETSAYIRSRSRRSVWIGVALLIAALVLFFLSSRGAGPGGPAGRTGRDRQPLQPEAMHPPAPAPV